MRGLMAILGIAGVGFVLYLYVKQTGGAPAGIGGAVPNVDPNGIASKGKDAAEAFYRQPWFWTFAVSAVAAVLGIMTWRRIGKWGQGVVLVLAAVAITVLVTR